MFRTHLRAQLRELNAASTAAEARRLRQRFASGAATAEDLAIAVELLAVNDVRRGGVNDPFEGVSSAD